MLFKIIIIFLCVVYLLRLLSPFLFKLLFSSLVKKAATQREPQQPQSNPKPKPKQNKTSSDSIGEYIDYEEVE
ncbi:DUF4834 family protein [Flavobacteriaceae bacterium]|nr:DUF4834 family protein [Flavobacteriaceae bacterium]MDB2340970.1 DUF4834 family protein [Flavobacteriaceae bacterium]